ncbi:MAG: hypothetical protein MUO42_12555 [Anaerolineaceae bacterium]|nr:hypothetical protein [Anaerolineaceae bacterium]
MNRYFEFLLIAVLFSGCSKLPLVSVLLGESSQATQENQLFIDDFSEAKSGWDRFSGEIGSTDYRNKAYQITVNEPNTDLFTNPSKLYKDTIIEVTATRIGGSDNNSFGVICRFQDEKNFYAAQISSDGYAGIFRMKDGDYQLLGQEKMIPVPAILGGSAANTIHFECIGRSLALAVNGAPVDAREDKSFDNGDVGLIAGTFEEAGVVIAFDDFKVTKP